MSGFSNSILGGASKLIRAAIQSPNYVPATTGWTINKDGSAEFNNLTIRGTFAGLKFIINSLGAFFYSGTPALGNLVASITSAAGANDGLGNPFDADITVYGSAGTTVQMLAATAAALNIGSGDSAETSPAFLSSAIFGSGPTRFIQTILGAARVSGQNSFRDLQILLEGDAIDHSFPTDLRIEITQDATTSAGITFTPTSFLFRGSPSNMFFIDLVNKLLVAGYPVVGASTLGGTGADPWHLMTPLLNSWAGAAAPNAAPQYRFTASRKVNVAGTLNGVAATAATFFNLPAAYRPTLRQVQAACGATGNVAANKSSFIQLDTAGNLTVSGANALPAAGVFTFDVELSLDLT
jgi:hypothetical protein